MTTDRDARTCRALDHLAVRGLDRSPWEGDFQTFTAWQRAWADYVHARAMAGHHFRRLEREAQEQAERERREAERSQFTGRSRQDGPIGPLSDDVVRAIRQRRAEGVDRTTVAEEFGVSPMTVSRIALRQRYGHVTD